MTREESGLNSCEASGLLSLSLCAGYVSVFGSDPNQPRLFVECWFCLCLCVLVMSLIAGSLCVLLLSLGRCVGSVSVSACSGSLCLQSVCPPLVLYQPQLPNPCPSPCPLSARCHLGGPNLVMRRSRRNLRALMNKYADVWRMQRRCM